MILRLIWLTLATVSVITASQRALLIGVGEYPSFPDVRPLQGPVNDVTALKRLLIDSWGFAARDIRTLVDSAATKAAILASLDNLIAETKPGDFVLLYYSGHGTSFHDARNRKLGMDMRTGAVLPFDTRPGTSKQILGSLIVGSIDLKPRLLRLEKKAEVMVLFDACYSGDSAKFIPQMISRNADLLPRGDEELMALIDQAEASTSDWPYSNLIYISAAARHEPAYDIPQALIDSGSRRTVDNKPHGAFTNGLLTGLAGAADLDHDGTITYQELHQYLLENVQHQFGQTPQLSPKGLDNPMTKKPLMSRNQAPPAIGSNDDTGLRVKVEPPSDSLAARLSGSANLQVVAKEYDVLAEASQSGYTVTHRSGAKMFFGALSRDAAVERLKDLAVAQRVMKMKYPSQSFNVNLAVEEVTQSNAETEGVYAGGSVLRLTMNPERKSWLLLMNVDVEGAVTVIYPNGPGDLREVSAGENVVAVESEVTQPFGTEGLKVVAFTAKPAGIDSFAGKTVKGGKELAGLTKLLQAGSSQTSRIVLSIPKQ